MATNIFFDSNYFGNYTEQTLVNSLMEECIQIQGYDIVYLPRESVNFDYLFGEDAKSRFTESYIIEAYIKNPKKAYVGTANLMSKFGLDDKDELTLQINIGRFAEVITTHRPDIIRPREGDLIYFGLDRYATFQISFVENKAPFYQLGELYLYEINMTQLNQNNEEIKTGIPDIDAIRSYGNVTSIALGTTQSPAVAFIIGEIAYQLNSNLIGYRASGEVLSIEGNILTLVDIKGIFLSGINIIGQQSLANYTFPIKSDDTFNDLVNNDVNDNSNVRRESNIVIDYNESNPFADTGYI